MIRSSALRNSFGISSVLRRTFVDREEGNRRRQRCRRRRQPSETEKAFDRKLSSGSWASAARAPFSKRSIFQTVDFPNGRFSDRHHLYPATFPWMSQIWRQPACLAFFSRFTGFSGLAGLCLSPPGDGLRGDRLKRNGVPARRGSIRCSLRCPGAP